MMHTLFRKLTFLCAVGVMLLVGGCAPIALPVVVESDAQSTPAATEEAAGAGEEDVSSDASEDAPQDATVDADAPRIITLGGPVTEIVFALGLGDHVVAVDSSSYYPEAVTALPQVGYQRRLAAEGVLALDPTLIIGSTEAGPPEAIQQLQDTGVDVLLVEAIDTVEGVKEKIRALAVALDREEEGEALIAKIEADLAEAEAFVSSASAHPKVLFIYARGAGAVNVAGIETGAHTMIELAGAENAVTDFEGYLPLTAEAAVAAAPDVILIFQTGLESIGGEAGLLEHPGVAQTPAAQNGRIVAMDGLYLLNFGPRMGEAVLELAQRIREE
jgi:iron complex transport system substrate-binding protein